MAELVAMPKYKAYKASGEDWIGAVPSNWDVVPIRSIFKFRNEKNDPIVTDNILSLSIAHGVTEYSEEGRGGNKRKDDLSAYKIAKPNDIVINSMNVIVGAVGLSKYFGAISPVYYALYTDNNEAYIKYYENVFQNVSFQRGLLKFGKGILIKLSGTGKLNTIRMKVSTDNLKTLNFPKPPYNEQVAIANFLDKKTVQIDEAVAIKQQQIELLKERKKIIIQQAVTQGLNPNAPMKDSGVDWIGEIPEHWEVSKLRYLGVTQNGISAGAEYFGSGFPFVSYGDVYKNRELPLTVSGLAKSSINDRNQYSILENDILFTRTSETAEEIGFASICMRTIENSTFAGFLIRFRPTNKLFKGFSKYYFNSAMMREYFVKQMNLVIRASLSQELLKNLPVLLPSLDEQELIFNYLEHETGKVEKAIGLQVQQIEKLKEYKTTLINSAVTGKIKVPLNQESVLS